MIGGGGAGGDGGGGFVGGADMLSGLDDDNLGFEISPGYSLTGSGDSTYRGYSLTLRYRPKKWLIFSAYIPYLSISGREILYDQIIVAGSPVDRRTDFTYSQQGLGDVSVMAWFNLAHPYYAKPEPPPTLPETATLPLEEEKPGKETDALKPAPKESSAPEKPEKKKNPLEGIGKPAVLFGIGLKLDTGAHDEWDFANYMYDRSKSTTGEYSISDGIIPSRFQLGSGTTDFLFGLKYQQRFGRWVPSAGLTYQLTGGENSVGYERGNKLSWGLGTKYIIHCTKDKRKFYVSGGISGLIALSSDVDHSENISMLYMQEMGDVEGTDEDFNFWDIGLGCDIGKYMSVSVGMKYPLGGSDETTESSFDRQFSLALTFKF